MIENAGGIVELVHMKANELLQKEFIFTCKLTIHNNR